MRKIIFILALMAFAGSATSQTLNPFPTTDSLRKFINKWIRNSVTDAFTNLRLNTAMIGVTRFIDSADGGGSGSHNSNIGLGFRVAVPNTNNIKTLFGSYGFVGDSTSNTNGITFKIDSTKFSTTRGLKDSMYRALNSMPMMSKIEFVQSGNSTTYTSSDLIGKYILMVSGEGYIYGTITRSSGYYSFNAATGTITIHNSQFSDDDYVLILYRTTPIYVTDGSGNYIVDDDGNYIIAN